MLSLTRLTIRRAREERLAQVAGSLTFTTVLSEGHRQILPFFAMMFIAAGDVRPRLSERNGSRCQSRGSSSRAARGRTRSLSLPSRSTLRVESTNSASVAKYTLLPALTASTPSAIARWLLPVRGGAAAGVPAASSADAVPGSASCHARRYFQQFVDWRVLATRLAGWRPPPSNRTSECVQFALTIVGGRCLE